MGKPTWKDQFEKMVEERKNPDRYRPSNPEEAIKSLLQLVSETEIPNRIDAEIMTEYPMDKSPDPHFTLIIDKEGTSIE